MIDQNRNKIIDNTVALFYSAHLFLLLLLLLFGVVVVMGGLDGVYAL